jgi:ketosteroid isomerase-like protein
MRSFVFIIAAALGLASLSSPSIAKTTTPEGDGLKAWTEVWSPNADVKNFSAERLSRVYNTQGIVSFDTNSPGSTIMNGWKAFRDTWVPYMKEAGFWETLSVKLIKAETIGDLAYTVITFTASAQPERTADRKIYENHATLIWKRLNGEWKVVHEHVSSPVKR